MYRRPQQRGLLYKVSSRDFPSRLTWSSLLAVYLSEHSSPVACCLYGALLVSSGPQTIEVKVDGGTYGAELQIKNTHRRGYTILYYFLAVLSR